MPFSKIIHRFYIDGVLEAKQAKDTLSDHETRDYDLGRLMAYHEVISFMQQQAIGFGISLNQIGLEDFDPERKLL
jgi:hypothetical protein